jgi:hypothetical protein
MSDLILIQSNEESIWPVLLWVLLWILRGHPGFASPCYDQVKWLSHDIAGAGVYPARLFMGIS